LTIESPTLKGYPYSMIVILANAGIVTHKFDIAESSSFPF
jgi:hypothetical protein